MQPSALRGRGPLRKHLGSSLRAMAVATLAGQRILYDIPATRASKPSALPEWGTNSAEWGRYGKQPLGGCIAALPTLRVLALRLRDLQFWLPIRDDLYW